MSFKKTILIDLDGVLNTYCGNFDINFIPPIREGTYTFLKNLSQEFNIKIFTTRNKLLTSKWLIENKLDEIVSDITNVKELCWLYIDDRCITFNGDYETLKNQIENKLALKILNGEISDNDTADIIVQNGSLEIIASKKTK